jgi:hypothetical protein
MHVGLQDPLPTHFAQAPLVVAFYSSFESFSGGAVDASDGIRDSHGSSIPNPCAWKPREPAMQGENEDYLPRRLQPHPPPPKSSTTTTTISIISHILI